VKSKKMLVTPLDNLPPESDFKCLGKAREIAHACPLNHGNVLETHASDAPIIQARLDGTTALRAVSRHGSDA